MPRDKWFNIKAQADDAPAEIDITNEIGLWGISANEFIAQLKGVQSPEIRLNINSRGGNLIDGLAMYNALRAHPARVNVRVLGLAASAASLVAMAGDSIVMPENSFMMLHNARNGLEGNAEELRDMADLLDKFDAGLVATYVARSGQSEEKVREMMADTTFLTAAEAVELGFADAVEPALRVSAAFDVDDLPDNVRAAYASQAAVDDSAADKVESAEARFPAMIEAAAKSAGLEAFAADFALDAKITDAASLSAAIAEASSIVNLCAIVKASDQAAGFIKARKSLEDVRAALIDARARADESIQINAHQPLSCSSGKQGAAASKASLSTADIWMRRQSQNSQQQ